MSNDNGFGSEIWKQAQRVRVTKGKVELPVQASKDGIYIGSAVPEKKQSNAAPDDDKAEGTAPPRRGFLSRLFRR